MQHVELWPAARVVEVVGLSKSVIYREMRAGRFPQNYAYRQFASRRFWLSSEVKAWQQAQLDKVVPELRDGLPQIDEFEMLLHDD